MKSRSLLIFALIVSLAVVPGMQIALAASTSSSSTTSSTTTTTTTTAPRSPYSEKLTIYTAGDNDFFLVSLSPVNATKPGLVSAETVSGMSAYQLTEVKSTGAAPGSQLFWGDGYKILKLPFMPDQGVFVNITATSQSVAMTAASDFNLFLGTDLQQIGSSGSNYTFFGPGNFQIAGNAIFASVPAAEKGLAGLFTRDTLLTQPLPTVVLSGVRSGSSFTRTVSYGSTETHGVGSNGSLSVHAAMNLAKGNFTSSPYATSTQLVVHSLDGLISSSDAATIKNHESNFSASYSIGVQPNTEFKSNVTILSDPPVLTATRTVDKGSAVSGDLVSVTLTLSNTAGTNTTLQNINVNDSWWKAYPALFSLSAGSPSINVASLAGGKNFTQVYVLKVLSTTSENLVIPATTATYSYGIAGITINGSTKTNQVELRTNDSGPDLVVQAGVSVPSGSPLGTAAQYVVTVKNVGAAPALNAQVGAFTDTTIQPGGVWKVNTTVSLNSLANRNLTQTFTLGWTAPDGSLGTLVSNPATIVFSHSGALLPLMEFNLNLPVSLTNVGPGLATVNATYNLYNAGNAAPNDVTVTQAFAPGLTCARVLTNANGTANCSSSSFSLKASAVPPTKTFVGTLLLNFSNDNYLTEPATISTAFSGLALHNAGAAFIISTGVSVGKNYTENPVFVGENEFVIQTVKNIGSLPVYNVTISSVLDFFANPVSGGGQAQFPTINPGASDSNNFTVAMVDSGNQTAGAISASYDFGGFVQSYTAPRIHVVVYKAIHGTTSTSPSTPIAGSDFSLTVNLQNPSPVTVTNVTVSIQIPNDLTIVNYSSGLQLSGRTVTLTVPSLAGEARASDSVTLRAATDGSISVPSGTLTFDYKGATVPGTVSSTTVVIGIDLLVHYEIPIGLAVLLSIAIAFYIHRKLPVPQAK